MGFGLDLEKGPFEGPRCLKTWDLALDPHIDSHEPLDRRFPRSSLAFTRLSQTLQAHASICLGHVRCVVVPGWFSRESTAMGMMLLFFVQGT